MLLLRPNLNCRLTLISSDSQWDFKVLPEPLYLLIGARTVFEASSCIYGWWTFVSGGWFCNYVYRIRPSLTSGCEEINYLCRLLSEELVKLFIKDIISPEVVPVSGWGLSSSPGSAIQLLYCAVGVGYAKVTHAGRISCEYVTKTFQNKE